MTKEVRVEFLCHADFEGVFDPPQPAAKFLPDYYKRMPAFSAGTKDRPVFNENGEPAQTMKKCMPVLDSMSLGYIIPVPTEIFCEDTGDFGKQFTWPVDNFAAIQSHPEGQFPGLPVPDEYDSAAAYKFINPWQIVTPPGYSVLFTQPMWHYDLPYHVFSGVVDTDLHPVAVNFPFIMRRNFSGYIERGTPMVQVIPFKREDYVGHNGVRDEEKNRRIWNRAKTQFNNNYKDFFRSPKTFR
jgi:hypothetical protein